MKNSSWQFCMHSKFFNLLIFMLKGDLKRKFLLMQMNSTVER